MKILFICKHNKFRSKVAEAYFNKINKNKKIRAISAGIIKGDLPFEGIEVEVAKKFNLVFKGNPKSVSTELLRSVDKVIIVADDVPKKLFNYDFLKGRVIIWRISDFFGRGGKVLIEKIIKRIIKKVDKLHKELGG